MTTYAPGTVCVATVRGVPNVRVMRGAFMWWGDPDATGGRLWDDGDVTDIRPLVVLDLDFRLILKHLSWSASAQDHDAALDAIVQQIQAQTAPPKPPEPTGLGAVVEDADGHVFVLAAPHAEQWQWWGSKSGWIKWEHVHAVKVLAGGMQP